MVIKINFKRFNKRHKNILKNYLKILKKSKFLDLKK